MLHPRLHDLWRYLGSQTLTQTPATAGTWTQTRPSEAVQLGRHHGIRWQHRSLTQIDQFGPWIPTCLKLQPRPLISRWRSVPTQATDNSRDSGCGRATNSHTALSSSGTKTSPLPLVIAQVPHICLFLGVSVPSFSILLLGVFLQAALGSRSTGQMLVV